MCTDGAARPRVPIRIRMLPQNSCLGDLSPVTFEQQLQALSTVADPAA